MRLIRFVRNHPVALLGVFVAAFVLWLWSESRPLREVAHMPVLDNHNTAVYPPDGGRFPPGDGWPRRPLPPPPLNPPENAKPDPQGTAQVLSKLKPGMTRAEVEQLVGTPAPDDILPATVSDGKVTYQTAYEADLGPLPTVRPIEPMRPHAKAHRPAPKGRTLVTLEFDATKPGHPLLGIHYPDPLF